MKLFASFGNKSKDNLGLVLILLVVWVAVIFQEPLIMLFASFAFGWRIILGAFVHLLNSPTTRRRLRQERINEIRKGG